MTDTWLYDQLAVTGEQPDAHYAFLGTAHWMRALALETSHGFDDASLSARYLAVQRRAPQPQKDLAAYEYLLLSLHNLSPLHSLAPAPSANPYDGIRAAIMSWYYTVYECASAMVLAASGDNAEEHRSTAKIFHAQIVAPGHAHGPFSLHLSSIVQAEVDTSVATLRNGSNAALVATPTSLSEARGALCSYLAGTAKYEQDRVVERVRNSRPFRDLGVDNFRTAAARQLRDAEFVKQPVNFLHQAFRYRGKSNYRDSIYLTYGSDWSRQLRTFWSDLATVATAFFRMAMHYIQRRVERDSWERFLLDARKNVRCTIPADTIP